MNLYPDQIAIYSQTGTTNLQGVYTPVRTTYLECECDVQSVKDSAFNSVKDKSEIEGFKRLYRVFLGGEMNGDNTYFITQTLKAGMQATLTMRTQAVHLGEIVEIDETDATLLVGVR